MSERPVWWLLPDRITAGVLLVLWTSIGLYLGVGGWVWADLEEASLKAKRAPVEAVQHGALNLRNPATLEVLLAEEKARPLFGWLESLPRVVLLVLTSCSFGALGGVVRLVSANVLAREGIGTSAALSVPFFGFLLGLLLLGLSILVPTALVAEPVTLEPASLFFICLFGGVFSDKAYSWIRDHLSSVFRSAEDGRKE